MNIKHILTLEHVYSDVAATSKKSALEFISKQFADTFADEPDTQFILEALMNREKIGSTALGRGIALPHARIPFIKNTYGVFVKLRDSIAYDAPDHHPIDLLFALLAPEDATESQLEVYAELTSRFRDEAFCEHLREAKSANEVYGLLI